MQFDFGAVLAFAVAALALGLVLGLIRRGFGRGAASAVPPKPRGSPLESPRLSAGWLWIAQRTVAVLIGLALLFPAALVLRRHVFDGRGAEAWVAVAAFIVPLVLGVGARRAPPS